MTAHIEQRGANRVRFEFDTRGEREVAALRIGLALVLLVAGAWLFALPYAVPRAFAAAGVAFAGLWLWRNARARRSAADQYALELGPDALILREAGVDIAVGWPDIESVAIDEDRLVVIVARKGAPALELQPHYRGVGLHELGDSVHKALITARAREGCAAALDG